jgi:dipeptidyl aminopeptidase/acylaminoacyl peptidase
MKNYPTVIIGMVVLVLGVSGMVQAQGTKADYERASKLGELSRGKVFRASVAPNWLEGGRLWYRVETGASAFEWVLAEADGKLQRFSSEAALKAALGGKLGTESVQRLTTRPQQGEAGERVDLVFDNQTSSELSLFWVSGSDRTPYGKVAPGKKYSQSTFGGHAWEVRDASGKVLGYATAPALGGTVVVDGKRAAPTRREGQRGGNPGASPDGRWIAFVKGDNLWVRPSAGGEAAALSTDGKPKDSYDGTGFFWSPDSTKVVAFRTEAAQEHKVYIVASSPKDQVQPKLITLDYLKPGDKIEHPRPVLFDVVTRKATALNESLFPDPWSLPALGDSGWGAGVTWSADSSRFFFAYNQRGHQLMRVISVDAASGTPKTLFEDATKTFINYSGKFWARYLAKSNEIVWMSERDGWNHVFVHDATNGKLKRQLTQGEWTVRGVESFDEDKGELLLRVAGRTPGEDPYHVHYARVSVATGALTPLTDGDGTHKIALSPDGTRYLDSYSRVDLPTITELRSTSDGKKLATLERGDAKALLATGWKQPERFVAKGRDGQTDIYGVLWRPTNFDPAKKYPVIEQIYAGPQGFFVPKQWSSSYGNAQQIAELGFLVVQIDGMGTDGRSKAFHDVCFKNLKDGGFPDRILWMKALAQKYPSLDLNRVGVYGGSAGGQNALAALLWHGDFYKAAVADCGCHDNRMDKVWWNEQWMSYPVDKSYEESSNVVNAHLLTGKLLLTVGEVDSNVDPASTMQVADALIKANKDYELIVFPGANHGAGESPYGKRRRMDFFVKNLLGVEPRGK